MKQVSRRLRRLEESFARGRNEQGRTPSEVLRERRCRRVAQERGVPYEQVLRESVIESQAFWDSYDGPGTIADEALLRNKLAFFVHPKSCQS
jgi:hypothetical protein